MINFTVLDLELVELMFSLVHDLVKRFLLLLLLCNMTMMGEGVFSVEESVALSGDAVLDFFLVWAVDGDVKTLMADPWLVVQFDVTSYDLVFWSDQISIDLT